MYNILNINLADIKLSDTLGKLSIALIIIGFHFYLIFEITFNTTSFRPISLVLAYAFFLFSLILKGRIKINTSILFYFTLSILLYISSFSFWLVPYDINVYLSAITAIIIVTRYEFFLQIMKIFIICTLIISFYEYLNKEYLFVVERQTYLGFRPLDEVFFGGLAGIFRAKVYFEGPLALSQFAMGMALIFRYNIKILYLILFIAIFANGRLGIFICTVIILLYYVKKYNIITLLLKPKFLILLIVCSISIVVVIFNLLDEASIGRLLEIFNTSNQGNSDRIQFWIKGVKKLLDTDLIHLIFGNSGEFESIYNNNAENGWLTLLLNNGILGFIYYSFPVIIIITNAIAKKSPVDMVYILLLIFCMFVQTFHLGASANLFYWLIIYSFLNHVNSNRKICL